MLVVLCKNGPCGVILPSSSCCPIHRRNRIPGALFIYVHITKCLTTQSISRTQTKQSYVKFLGLRGRQMMLDNIFWRLYKAVWSIHFFNLFQSEIILELPSIVMLRWSADNVGPSIVVALLWLSIWLLLRPLILDLKITLLGERLTPGPSMRDKGSYS